MLKVPRHVGYLFVAVLVAACGGRDMRDQPKYLPYASAAGFPRDAVMQPPLPGTVARGDLAAQAVLAERPGMSLALLQRGHQRFDIYCAPCHGRAGYGDGIVVQRGFPPPPSYHSERLRAAAPEHFVQVMTHGWGVMYSYAARVPPADRWAIAAYIRALQLSQHAAVARLPAADRRRLGEPAS